jgi:hypothetical protein
MGKYSEAFVAFDVAKMKHAVAIAEGGRTGEVRFLGDVENAPLPIEPASTGWTPVQAQSATVLGSRQSRTVRLTAADPSADSAEARRSQVER